MGKIYGENLWGKLMGKINGTFQRCKLIEKFPISSNQGNGNKRFRDFHRYFFP